MKLQKKGVYHFHVCHVCRHLKRFAPTCPCTILINFVMMLFVSLYLVPGCTQCHDGLNYLTYYYDGINTISSYLTSTFGLFSH